MTLPTDEEYIEVLFKLQKYVVVSGHAEQVGIAPDTEAYRFNVKLPLDPPLPDDDFKKYADECFAEFSQLAKEMFPWINDILRAGRNKGWAVVTLKDSGVDEWNKDWRALHEQEDRDEDGMEILWMLIQNRLSDLDELKEFVDDQIETYKSRAQEWAAKNSKKDA
jgi:hypothetical protein